MTLAPPLNRLLVSKSEAQSKALHAVMAAFLSLADELHEAIATHLPLEDLLNLSCTNHRLHKMITGSTDVWSNLHGHIFGPILGRLDADETDPRAAFIKRCIPTLEESILQLQAMHPSF